MFPSPPERLIQEIDEKIEDITQVITKFGDFNLLQAKLSNLKLKKLKLIALSRLPPAQSFAPNVMSAIDMMITESDIDIEVKTIRSSKNYKRMERRRRERFFRGPYTRQSSYGSDYSEEMLVHSQPVSENTQQTAPLDLSNCFHHPKSVCNKSTNTEPVYIINTKDNVMSCKRDFVSPISSDEEMSPFEERQNDEEISSHMSLEVEICPVEERKSPDKIRQPKIILKSPIDEFMTAQEIISSSKEVISSTKDDNSNAHILLDSIQSKWFDKTFESDKLVKETPLQISEQTMMSSSQSYSEKSQKNKKVNNEIPETSQGVDANQNSFYCKPHTDTTELKSHLSNETPSKVVAPELSHNQIINLFNTYKTIHSSNTCIKNYPELSNIMQSQNNSNDEHLPKTRNFNKSLGSGYYLKKLDYTKGKHASTPKNSSGGNSSTNIKKPSKSEKKRKKKSRKSPDSKEKQQNSLFRVHVERSKWSSPNVGSAKTGYGEKQ